MTSDDLRRRILTPEFIDILLPQSGSLRILPFVSCRAMEAYAAKAEDPKTAFRSMITYSIEGAPDSVPQMTESDYEELARLYGKSMGFLAEYEHSRETAGVFESFHKCFTATDIWRDWARSTKRLHDQVASQERMVRSLNTVARDLTTAADPSVKWAKSAQAQPLFRQWWDASASLAPPAHTAISEARTRALERLASDSAISQKAFLEVTTRMTGESALQDAVSRRSRSIDAVIAHTAVAKDLLRSQTDFLSSFNQLPDRLSALGAADSQSALDLANRAFADASETLEKATKYFETRPAIPEPIASLPLPLGDKSRAMEADASFPEAANELDRIVHESSAEVVRITNESLPLLQDALKGAIRDSLKEYEPLLRRMKALASPDTILDKLKEFAVHFQRDHWRDLWVGKCENFKPGPESIARMALSMYMLGSSGGAAFVGREIGNGDGFVDLLVNFLGVDHVVEVKIVGGGWGVGDAELGLVQLDAYLGNYGQAEGYLLVFDGRKTKKGKQLSSKYTLVSGRTVHVVTVQSYFDRPSA